MKAGEVKIHAHKIVLIAHSALFRGMFQVIPVSNGLAILSFTGDIDNFLQSGTYENTAEEVEMGQIEGPVLTALLSFMYGRLEDIRKDIALPLFVAADAHQAKSHMWFCAELCVAFILLALLNCFRNAGGGASLDLSTMCTGSSQRRNSTTVCSSS